MTLLPAKFSAAVAIAIGVTGSSLLCPVQAHESNSEVKAQDSVQQKLDESVQGESGLQTTLPRLASGNVLLPGVVVIDARHDLRIVARQNGTIEAPVGGFVLPGQKVVAGQVLARLRPAYSQPERRDLETEYAAAHRDGLITRLQVDRFQLDGTQPFDIKLATPTLQLIADYRSAQVRETQLMKALHDDITIVAPRDGVILRIAARAGGVVVAGQALFQLSADGGMAVSAEYSDSDIESAKSLYAWTVDRQQIGLKTLGESYDPELRLHRVLYTVSESALSLSPGEPVQIVAQLKSTEADR